MIEVDFLWKEKTYFAMKNEEWMRMKNKQLLTFDHEESKKGWLLIPFKLLFLLMYNDKSVLFKLKMSLRIYLELSWPNCLEFDTINSKLILNLCSETLLINRNFSRILPPKELLDVILAE